MTKSKLVKEVGYEMMILHEMSSKFNFTFELIDIHRDWGTLLVDDQWSGIMGLLVNKVLASMLTLPGLMLTCLQ